MTGPVLETERLILRPIAMEDFPRWAEMMGDSEAARFLGGVQPASVAWRGFMTMAGAWSLTGVSMCSIIGRETGLWLGRAGLVRNCAQPRSGREHFDRRDGNAQCSSGGRS